MRKDMKDLLVNTGRRGGGGKANYSRSALRDADPDTLPSRIPTGRHRIYGYDAKELGDRLAPLKRFLEANCGRPWADVYSEICKVADHRSIRGYHLRQHVWQYVVPSNHGGYRRHYGPFFVDIDGTLQKEKQYTAEERHERWLAEAKKHKDWPREKRKVVNPRVVCQKEPKDHYWEKIEGFWYEFKTTHTVRNNSYLDLREVNGEVEIVRIPLRPTTHHETTKRQVGSKESKQLDALIRAGALKRAA